MATLAAIAALLLFGAALRELWAERAAPRAGGLRAAFGWSIGLLPQGLLRGERQIAAAGLESRLDPRVLAAARMIGAIAALPLAVELAPIAPGHSGLLLPLALPVAAALAPDLYLQRLARERRRRIATSLPAVLELMALSAASGHGPAALVHAAAPAAEGPLGEELRQTAAELRCGAGAAAALGELARRGGPELGALTRSLERSRRVGAPLAERLRDQAAELNAAQRLALDEQAQRAAPKMQLVVALLLVPSVLLIVAAALLANADALLAGL